MSSQKRLPHPWLVGVGLLKEVQPLPSPETLSVKSSQQATVESPTSSASPTPCAQNQNKKIPTYFSNMLIQEKGWRVGARGWEGPGPREGPRAPAARAASGRIPRRIQVSGPRPSQAFVRRPPAD